MHLTHLHNDLWLTDASDESLKDVVELLGLESFLLPEIINAKMKNTDKTSLFFITYHPIAH